MVVYAGGGEGGGGNFPVNGLGLPPLWSKKSLPTQGRKITRPWSQTSDREEREGSILYIKIDNSKILFEDLFSFLRAKRKNYPSPEWETKINSAEIIPSYL